MKKIASTLILAAGLLWNVPQAKAQLKLPAASSGQEISQDLGIGTIQLKYQRPNMRQRVVFGELVPFGQVWRTGANDATTITFSTDVQIEGKNLAAGTYGLFTIPEQGQWTIIFSKNPEQWGAYNYDEADDVLRIQVQTSKLDQPVETFTISFNQVLEQSLVMALAWEQTQAEFNVSVDQKAEILASIDAAMQGDKKPYFPAAMYYFKNDLDLSKAVEWVKEADKGNTSAAHIKYWKSLILAKSGDRAGAVQAAEEGLSMAQAADNAEYIKLNTEALDAAKK